MNRISNNRSGYILDTLTLSIGALLAIVILYFGYTAINTTGTTYIASNTGIAASTATTAFNVGSAIDQGAMVGLIIVLSLMLYSAYTIGTNFTMFSITFLISIVCLLTLPSIEQFLTITFYNNSYVAAQTNLPGITFLVTHFTLVMTGFAGLLLIALYLRPSTGTA